MKWLDVIARVLEGLINAINKKKQIDAVNNPADTISSGGRVQQSDKSFSDISGKSERDKVE